MPQNQKASCNTPQVEPINGPAANLTFTVNSQIRHLVTNLNKKHFKLIAAELKSLHELFGNEVLVLLIRHLIAQVDFKDISKTPPKDQLKLQLLTQEFGFLFEKSNYSSLILQTLDSLPPPFEDSLAAFVKLMKPNYAQELSIALILLQSKDSKAQQEGFKTLSTKLQELQANVHMLSEDTVQTLASTLLTNEAFSANRVAFLKIIEKAFPSALLESPKELQMKSWERLQEPTDASSLASLSEECDVDSLMEDLGYSCCSSVPNFKHFLSQFGEISENEIARILGMIARTSSSPLEENQAFNALVPTNEKVQGWNTNAFVDTIKELYPKTSWQSVIKKLDFPGFTLCDHKGLNAVISIYKRATKESFPVDLILEKWKSTSGQLSFIKSILTAPPEISVNFVVSTNQAAIAAHEGMIHTKSILPLQLQLWCSHALVQALLYLSEKEPYSHVRTMFDYPIKHCPEALLITLVQVKTNWNALHVDLVFNILMPSFLQSHPNSSAVMHHIWAINKPVVKRAVIEVYNRDKAHLSRLLDVAHDLKVIFDSKELALFLEMPPFGFALDLASLASRREYLNLEKWLQDHINEHGVPFLKACIHYIEEKLQKKPSTDAAHRSPQVSVSLSTETLNIYFSCLQARLNMLPQEYSDKLKQLNAAYVNFPPEIENEANKNFQKIYSQELSVEEGIALLRSLKTSRNPWEEKVFNCMVRNLFDEYKFFAKFPDKELRITGILFGSLIQHQLIASTLLIVALRYVMEALKKPVGSKLHKFGLLALEQFQARLHEWPLYCEHILPILKQSESPMAEYVERLIASLSAPGATSQPSPSNNSPNLVSTPSVVPTRALPSENFSQPHMVPSTPIGSQSSSSFSVPSQLSEKPSKIDHSEQDHRSKRATEPAKIEPEKPEQMSFGSSLNIDTMLKAAKTFPAPDESLQGKTYFIFNNVSAQNMDVKAAELREILTPDHYTWLAQYLVVKRASLELNFHTMYQSFLEKLQLPGLMQAVIAATYENIKILLKSEKIRSSSSERLLLKNLGSWLGSLTLARSKPLLHRHISFKDLILEAYEHGKLIAVVPFVGKVLATVKNSKIFAPPNVWVMAVIRLLVELYNLPELKQMLKCEIESLCTNLGLNINEIRPSTLLANRQQPRVNNPDIPAHTHVPAPPPAPPSPPPEEKPSQSPYGGIVINLPDPGILGNQPHKLIYQAMHRAIAEIISPVVDRSVPIAVITTRQLISKDFVTEVDEQKILKSAYLMVQYLAGSLALVTCKEPLRVSMSNHLRLLIQGNSEQQSAAIEHAIQVICADNLDLACSVVEKAATERAAKDVAEALSGLLALRAKHKERASNQPFFDGSQLSGRPFGSLPELLRPKAGGLQAHQLKVYEDFLRIQRPIQSISPPTQPQSPSKFSSQVYSNDIQAVSEQDTEPPHSFTKFPNPKADQINSSVNHRVQKFIVQQGTVNQRVIHPESGEPVSPKSNGEPDISEKLKVLFAEVETWITKLGNSTLNTLTADHELVGLIKQMVSAVSQSSSREEAGFLVALLSKRVVAPKPKNDTNKIRRDVYLLILESLAEPYKQLPKELTGWIMGAEIENFYFNLPGEAYSYFSTPFDVFKYYSETVAAFIRSRLLVVPEYDAYLAKKLETGMHMEAILYLIKYLLLDSRTLIYTDLPHSVEILSRLAQSGKIEGLNKLLDAAKQAVAPPAQQDSKKNRIVSPKESMMMMGELPIKQQVLLMLEEWHRVQQQAITQQGNSQTAMNEKALISKVQQGMLVSEDNSIRFFRTCMEVSAEYCTTSSEEKGPSHSMQYNLTDAFAKMIVSLMKLYPDPTAKVNLLKVAVGAILHVLSRDHEAKKIKFNQRPYHHVLAKLLVELSSFDPSNEALNWYFLSIFSNALANLGPSNFPGFSFSWLDLISHRMFMPKLLQFKNKKGWPLFHPLLMDLFRFLEPHLRNADLTESIRALYKGTLRVLLVLLHDFSEFLCEYHFDFCNVIPTSCIQLRNLILCASPPNVRLPDPYTPNLKVDLLPEISQSPTILSNYAAALIRYNLKGEVDHYLKNRPSGSFLPELKNKLLLSAAEAYVSGMRYNVELINSLVLYVGVQSTSQVQSKSIDPHSLEIFQYLINELEAEGRYLFLNAIANQLRYPNNQTHYFSCMLLLLFSVSNEVIQEQITRVLLERLVVKRPHPWGLFITFYELIKFREYNFWSKSFIRSTPDMERFFEWVATSFLSNHQKPTNLVDV